MAKIHPTAIVHPSARLADEVEVRPYAVIEADVQIGAGSVIGEYCVIRRYTQMGSGNMLDAHIVLGGLPQDLKFSPQTATYLRIGDNNIFREGVTISRATVPGGATTVGSRTYWMSGSHAGHDSTVEDEVILVNHSVVAGHATIGRKAILSAGVGVHQFCWVGQMVMTQGYAGISMHIPPYCMVEFGINHVHSLNSIGLRRRADFTDEDRRQIKEAFHLTYRAGLKPAEALARMDACKDWGKPAGEFRDFIRKVLDAKKPFRRGFAPISHGKGRGKTQ
jgi:UDP-N-acetylglucosamine acyltransferase